MRAAFFAGPGLLEIRELADPSAESGGVVVDIDLCGICGTDLHAYQSGDPYPVAVCGHEWTGCVSAAGADVDGLREGDRVVVSVPQPCGTCALCRRGDESHCARSFAAATGRDRVAATNGGFADRIAVDASRVMRVDYALPLDVLAQVEPATVAYHATGRTNLRADDLVVILGAGPIGLLVAQWVRLAGAGHIVMVEPQPARALLAEQLGADTVVAPGETAVEVVQHLAGGAGGADVVFECVGNGQSIQEAVELARRGGGVCLTGMSKGEAQILPSTWVSKELDISTAIAYRRHEFAEVLEHLADGSIDVTTAVTATVGLGSLGATMASLVSPSNAQVKVLVDPRKG